VRNKQNANQKDYSKNSSDGGLLVAGEKSKGRQETKAEHYY